MSMSSKCFFFFFCNLCLAVTLINGSNNDERKSYIVYMGELPKNTISLADVHHNLLLETIGNEHIAREAKIHSYGRSFNALAARLLPHEANLLSQNENVVSVFPSKIRQLRTTRSWDFLEMPLNVERNIGRESDIIVGLLDSGIYVPSPSFNDSGFGPPPRKWKGKCQTGINFTGCNNKVIGAQYFHLSNEVPVDSDEISPADFVGHGTHTSSTAAGIAVANANYNGMGNGTARGGAPSARIASYKVCWPSCPDEDILAGFDAAISDGVDIISVSLGGPTMTYFDNPIAIGAFHAIKKGIFVSCSAGNDGPELSTVENVAPWVMTVAASTIDRNIDDSTASTTKETLNATVPIVSEFSSRGPQKLSRNILKVEFNTTVPIVAEFSSRGPQKLSRNILKPDITAPGVSILAAYTGLDPDENTLYYFESGTSMSAPHVSGTAAYVKSFHPDWSPAAIKSAIMTTAKQFKSNEIGEQLAYGSGEIDPTRALNPGLIYDLKWESYISFLCKEGYNNSAIAKLTGEKVNCSSFEPAKGTDGLNYPSMHIQINSSDISAVFYRTVTYVGQGKSVFTSEIRSPKGLSVTVSPNTLTFNETNQENSFNVTLKGKFVEKSQFYLSASLIWSDDKHIVRSPILVYREL